MNKNSKKKLDFLPNKLNKYSIRRFTVGTASILVGATLIFGVANDQQKPLRITQLKSKMIVQMQVK